VASASATIKCLIFMDFMVNLLGDTSS